MIVKELHALLSKALEDRPDITNMQIHVDGEIDETKELGIHRYKNVVFILCEDSYKHSELDVISYEI